MQNNSSKTKEAAVLFSGGVDCSLAAILLRKENYRVHLLHYNHGAVISNNLHVKRFNELKSLVGENNILLTEINHSGLFRKLSLANIEQDFSKYETNLICLGCRMAMHCETIIYAKQNNICRVTDGSVKYQDNFPEQNSVSLSFFKKLYQQYNIDYSPLLANVTSAKEVKYELLDNGISIQSMEDTCLFNNTFSPATDQNINAYLNERFEICNSYITQRLSIAEGGNINENN